MLTAFNGFIVAIVAWVLRVFRLPGLNSTRFYAVLGAPGIQPLLERLGRRRALEVFRIASKHCPAYAEFLQQQGAPAISRPSEFALIPETNKENFVRKFSIEARCIGGRIPSRGVVIDESSGSSGVPNNWVRGMAERSSVRRLLRHGFALTFPGEDLFLLNCFALGPWATGMNLSMSLADAVVLKSIGPDKLKLENTLKTFGPKYTYVVTGYPPFIKDWLDTRTLELSPYFLHLIVGGEGISEGLRDSFLKTFKSVHSSYGASDLEINIAAETERSIALRRLCASKPELCRALFGRDDAPMVFQYNPLDYLVERSDQGELVITLLRRGNAAPKVRYNIHDVGGMITWREVEAQLRKSGVDPATLPRGAAFPVMFVFGRSDLTVAFYGAKLYPTDMEAVINADPELRAAFHSFQMKVVNEPDLSKTLTITLERAQSAPEIRPDIDLPASIYEGLKRTNQDFREVSKMFGAERVRVEVCGFTQGPFRDRDIRVKQKYIGG